MRGTDASAEFLEYLRSCLPEAEIRQWGDLDSERPVLLRMDMAGIGCRYLSIAPAVWNSASDLSELQAYLERHRWRDRVLSSVPREHLTLGPSGWLSPDRNVRS